jgi:anti-sigma-K factor RskA
VSANDTDSNQPEADDLAAQYVLGMLDADAQQAAEKRMARDRAFAREVYAWQDRLLPLGRRVAPHAVSATVLGRLLERVGGRTRVATAWWMRAGLWQAVSAFSIILVVALALRGPVGPDQAAGPRYLAVLNSPGNEAVWLVEVAAGDVLRLKPVGAMPAVPAAKSLQFWTKPKGASRPTSLGLVRVGQSLEVPRASLPAVEREQLFEVTLEPEYGSLTGRPTGPVLAIGRMIAL